MAVHVLLYQVGLVIAGLLCSGTAVYAGRHWERRDAKLLVGLLGSIVFWVVMAFLVALTRGTTTATLAERLQYPGVTGTVLFLFLLTLQYTGREGYITRRTVGLLLLHPVLVTVAIWTPPLSEQFIAYGTADAATFTGVESSKGSLFYVHTLYSYLLLIASTAMLVDFALSSDRLYRQQVLAILVAVVAPWLGNVIFLFTDVVLDITSMAFAITGIGFGWAIFRQDFLNVLPVARSTVVDNIDAGVMVLDRADQVVDINDACRGMLDLGDADIIGRDTVEVLADYPELRSGFESVAAERDELDAGVTVGDRHYHVQLSPLSDRQDALIGRLFLVNDITDQKRRQQELERQNEQLDQFAQVVSHDLRNPLNVAAGKLELCRMETRGGEKYFDDVEQALDRIDAIIDDVLTLAREGRRIDDREQVQLGALARRARENVDAPAASLVVETDRSLRADPDSLQRAFENLIRNAVEHGRPDVMITVGATDDGFYVADDGPGIPEAERDSVFENGFTTSEAGTGFGLAIVRSIVAAHGWEISVGESESGGAAFVVRGGPELADEDVSGEPPIRKEVTTD